MSEKDYLSKLHKKLKSMEAFMNSFKKITENLKVFEVIDSTIEQNYFYYQGVFGSVELEFEEENEMKITYSEDKNQIKEEYACQSTKQFDGIIQTIMTKIERKMRLRNVFESPTCFYEQMIDNLFLLNKNVDRNKILEILRKKYTSQDIEEWCCSHLESSSMTKLNQDEYIFPIIDSFIYIDLKNQSYSLVKKDEETIEKIVQSATNNLKSALMHYLKSPI